MTRNFIVLLPTNCSLKVNGANCKIPPSHIVSIENRDGEYMIGVVCDSHLADMEKRLSAMQSADALSEGNIKTRPIKVVSTDCVRVDNEDYIEIELQRENINDKRMP